jgi:hypothetical protein
MDALKLVFLVMRSLFVSRAALAAENLAHRHLAQLAPGCRHREAGNRRSLAPARLQAVLALEVKSAKSADFFTLPTVSFRVHNSFVVLRHERRRVVHFNVTASPTAEWTAQQVIEAFPHDEAPRYLIRIRDRDSIYGEFFKRRVKGMGIEEAAIAPRAPWQDPHAERSIGSIRRECLYHAIILNEEHLRRLVSAYLRYYHADRTHSSPGRNAPFERQVEPPEAGRVIAEPRLGGLHHGYRRLAA